MTVDRMAGLCGYALVIGIISGSGVRGAVLPESSWRCGDLEPGLPCQPPQHEKSAQPPTGGEGRRGERGMRDRRRGPWGERGGRPGRSDENRWPPLSPELETEILGALRPFVSVRFHDTLVQTRQTDPKKFEQLMRRLRPLSREYFMLKRRHPDLAPLVLEEFGNEHKLRVLGYDYRKAVEDKDDEAAAEHATEIERLAERQFDIKVKRRQVWLEDFGKRLDAQQERLESERARLERDLAESDESIQKQVERIKKGRKGGNRSRRGRGGSPDDKARRRGERPSRKQEPPPDDQPFYDCREFPDLRTAR